jgi:hypothetical protein
LQTGVVDVFGDPMAFGLTFFEETFGCLKQCLLLFLNSLGESLLVPCTDDAQSCE